MRIMLCHTFSILTGESEYCLLQCMQVSYGVACLLMVCSEQSPTGLHTAEIW